MKPLASVPPPVYSVPAPSAPAAPAPVAPAPPFAAVPATQVTPLPRPAGPPLGWVPVTVAAVLALSPLFSGYFDFTAWGALALAAIALLVLVAWSARPRLTRYGLAVTVGLGTLLALSAASILWAGSKESAWTSVNRLALYAVLFAIVLLSAREHRTGRHVMLVLGAAALMTSLVLCAAMLIGGAQGAFLTRRLNAPIGYINGTAGLLVMGMWPWLACAESASRRLLRAGALAGAALIAGTLVLTQSRAIVPAAVLSATLVLLCADGRLRRAINLLLVGGAVAVGLPWTLAVYSSGGAAARLLAPGGSLLRAAALAIVLAAAAAGVARWALSACAERLGTELARRVSDRLRVALLLAAIAAFGLGSIPAAPWISRAYHSFTALHVNQDASVRFVDASGFRYDLWRVALHELRSHPLGGLGAGNYDTEYYRLRRNPEYVVQPHSLELQMAAELGVGGVIGLALLCGGVLWACFARFGTLAAGDRLVKVAAAGMFAAWLVDTSVDWLYDIPGLAGMALVAAALLVARSPGARGSRSKRRVPMLAGGAGLIALALVAASVGRQYAADRYQQAGASQLASSPAKAIGTLRQAARLDPYSLQTLYSLAAAYARQDDYSGARAALELAAAREPSNYVPPALLGDLAVRRGDRALAAAEYRRALALNPGDPMLQQAETNAAGSVGR